MDLEKKSQTAIDGTYLKIEESPAFEKLLKVLVDYGMDEEKAAQMIADCIDEQYELDELSDKFFNMYSEAKKEISQENAIFELHERLVKSGMSDDAADLLAAKFLEQEAQDYVD